MSDNEEVPADAAPEVEPEEPRTFLTQEKITEGLSLIQRTTGKFDYFESTLQTGYRMPIVL